MCKHAHSTLVARQILIAGPLFAPAFLGATLPKERSVSQKTRIKIRKRTSWTRGPTVFALTQPIQPELDHVEITPRVTFLPVRAAWIVRGESTFGTFSRGRSFQLRSPGATFDCVG